MDVKRLEYFCAIVEHGQISRAARALHISQPPLSQRLKELEDELGVKLLHRRGSVMEPTPEGAELYKRAKYILSFMNSTKDDIKSAAGQVSGLVRIGVCSPCQAMVYNLVPDMHREFPNIRFRLWIMDHQSLERHMQENNLDIALILLPLQHENYSLRLLPPLHYMVVYGEGFSAPAKDAVTAHDLDNLPLIIGRRVGIGGSSASLLRAFQEQDCTMNIRLETQDSGVLVKLLELGLPGVYIIPAGEDASHDTGRFEKRRLAIDDVSRTPALAVLGGMQPGRACQALLEYMLERLGGNSLHDE